MSDISCTLTSAHVSTDVQKFWFRKIYSVTEGAEGAFEETYDFGVTNVYWIWNFVARSDSAHIISTSWPWLRSYLNRRHLENSFSLCFFFLFFIDTNGVSIAKKEDYKQDHCRSTAETQKTHDFGHLEKVKTMLSDAEVMQETLQEANLHHRPQSKTYWPTKWTF